VENACHFHETFLPVRSPFSRALLLTGTIRESLTLEPAGGLGPLIHSFVEILDLLWSVLNRIIELMPHVKTVCFVCVAVECAFDAAAATAVITADNDSRFTATLYSHCRTLCSAANAVDCRR